MAWTPISGTVPQYQTSTGALASGYYLKFYQTGTTTAFNMATDGTGGTTIDKAQLDSSGYPTTDGSTRFIPHVNQKYKIVLYKNATDADANTTGNADWVIDAIEQTADIANTEKIFETVAAMVADTTLNVGDHVRTLGYTAIGDGGGNEYAIVAAATGTDDGGEYIDLATHQAQGLFPTGIRYVEQWGAVGNGSTDDHAVIQAALDASSGKVISFVDSSTYKTTDTLLITGHATTILGNNATIDYHGTAHAIGYNLVSSTTYPVNMRLRDLAIVVNTGTSSTGIIVRTSSSEFRNVTVTLKAAATSAKGFTIPGDETNGTGPYYNNFYNCRVQSQSSGTDHKGFFFSTAAPLYRGPNANNFYGGRVGQCATAFEITGNGNTFNGVTIECVAGTGTGYKLVGPVASKNTQNQIMGGYIENIGTLFDIDANTAGTMIQVPYTTGVTTLFNDSSTTTQVLFNPNSPNKLVEGIDFANVVADSGANVLDYYEEGTWTPVISDASSGGNTASATIDKARYTRVGPLVTLMCSLTDIDTTGMTGGNNLHIQGLPFTSASDNYSAGHCITDNVTYTGELSPSIFTSTSVILFRTSVTAGADGILQVSALNSTVSDITLTISYWV